MMFRKCVSDSAIGATERLQVDKDNLRHPVSNPLRQFSLVWWSLCVTLTCDLPQRQSNIFFEGALRWIPYTAL